MLTRMYMAASCFSIYSGFFCESLQWMSEEKNSHGLWPSELKSINTLTAVFVERVSPSLFQTLMTLNFYYNFFLRFLINRYISTLY